MNSPQGYVDCHFHVVADPTEFPMYAARAYTPPLASLQQWRDTLAPLGFSKGVLVQPSFYGTDNRLLLATLANARDALPKSESVIKSGGDLVSDLVGVAAFDETISDAKLTEFTQAGVRAVRLAHYEASDPRSMGGFVMLDTIENLSRFADRLAAHGMHIQLLSDSRLLPGIESRLVLVKVPIVLDHMGRTPAHFGVAHAGMVCLKRLLVEGKVWVKLSGVANISEQSPSYEDARSVHEALVASNPEQLIWGSDWPHTRVKGTPPATLALFDLFAKWTPSDALREKILMTNPAKLYQFSEG